MSTRRNVPVVPGDLPGDPSGDPSGDLGPPLTARSVLASALLGTEPPELPVARLVAVAALFGISENSTRVALTRMARHGEVTAVEGRYRLVGPLAARGRRQRESRDAPVRTWRGDWTVVVLDGERRSAVERATHRRELVRARLGELREGVWLRPDNLAVDLPDDLTGRTLRMRARPDAPGELAHRLFDLDAWSARAGLLLGRLAEAPTAHTLAAGFVLSAAVLRHLQADPLLPAALEPEAWPGHELRAVYDAWDADYRSLLADWHRAWPVSGRDRR